MESFPSLFFSRTLGWFAGTKDKTLRYQRFYLRHLREKITSLFEEVVSRRFR